MPILKTTQLTAGQKEAMFRLWNQEYPEKVGFVDMAGLDKYLAGLNDITYYLLLNDTGDMEGWAITFTRENEKWFALVVDSRIQGRGNGSLMLNKLKENEPVLNGWAIDHENDVTRSGAVYRSPVMFYIKNGFTICPDVRLETPAMSAVKINWKRN